MQIKTALKTESFLVYWHWRWVKCINIYLLETLNNAWFCYYDFIWLKILTSNRKKMTPETFNTSTCGHMSKISHVFMVKLAGTRISKMHLSQNKVSVNIQLWDVAEKNGQNFKDWFHAEQDKRPYCFTMLGCHHFVWDVPAFFIVQRFLSSQKRQFQSCCRCNVYKCAVSSIKYNAIRCVDVMFAGNFQCFWPLHNWTWLNNVQHCFSKLYRVISS